MRADSDGYTVITTTRKMDQTDEDKRWSGHKSVKHHYRQHNAHYITV